MSDRRPNPDQLLSEIQRQEEKKQRGQLKIFFGSCAGVGKTYAMLQAAQQLKAENKEVVVGIIETHGRSETALLVKGLEILPLKNMEHRGKHFKEFDLDAALQRNPSLILIDELAHSNIEGSRHPKRYQDVEELLNAGIDVYTTMNVQHLESLKDIVYKITGVLVAESIPDSVFIEAEEVILVDLPPDELLQRLQQGKVYLPDQSRQAIQNFFRKGNLIALRELALREVADRVDVQMRKYRTEQDIQSIWQAKERLLVCISPRKSGEMLIRKAYMLASSLRAEWITVYVETPSLQKLSQKKRDKILKNLKLAGELGAETVILAGTNVVSVLVAYARSRNVSKIVVGQTSRSLLVHVFRPALSEQLANRLTDIDVYIIGRGPTSTQSDKAPSIPAKSLEFESEKPPKSNFVWPAIIWLATTLVSFKIAQSFELINIAVLYLLTIVIISVRYGKNPGLLASYLSVLSFYFFFIPPQWSLSYSKITHYYFSFILMVAATVVISNVISNLRTQVQNAMRRERRTKAVYTLSKELSGSLTIHQIVEISQNHLEGVFQAQAVILLPDHNGHIQLPYLPSEQTNLEVDLGLAQWVYINQQAAGFGTETLPASKLLYLPLRGAMRIHGIIAIAPKQVADVFLPEQERLLDIFVALIASAIERIHYVEVARDALLAIESQRLRSNLLDTISQNLRLPLTEILELSHRLTHQDLPTTVHNQLVNEIYDKTLYVNSLLEELK